MDIRQYSIEMVNQKSLSHGFSRISDITLIKNSREIPISTVKSTTEFRAAKGLFKSNGGIIVSSSPIIDALASNFIEECENIGNPNEIRRTIPQALEFYNLQQMSEVLEKELKMFDKYVHQSKQTRLTHSQVLFGL